MSMGRTRNGTKLTGPSPEGGLRRPGRPIALLSQSDRVAFYLPPGPGIARPFLVPPD